MLYLSQSDCIIKFMEYNACRISMEGSLANAYIFPFASFFFYSKEI